METPSNPLLMRLRAPTSPQADARFSLERGAVLVEFALVVVVLFTLIFGLIEGGVLMRARNAVNSSVDEAARRGAVAANAPNADWQILQQLRVRGLLNSARVNRVVVFNAEGPLAQPSELCRSGVAVADTCNVYGRADFGLASSAFSCADPNLDANWCPTDRQSEDGEIGYLGVWVDAEHAGFSHVFGDIDLDGMSVAPLEATS